MFLLFQGGISRFHVNFQGFTLPENERMSTKKGPVLVQGNFTSSSPTKV